MKKFEILGTGCSKCTTLQHLTEQAAKELGIPYQLNKVTDIKQIMSYGVMITPALVVDGQVKVIDDRFTIKALANSRQLHQRRTRTRLYIQFLTLSHVDATETSDRCGVCD